MWHLIFWQNDISDFVDFYTKKGCLPGQPFLFLIFYRPLLIPPEMIRPGNIRNIFTIPADFSTWIIHPPDKSW